MLINLRNALMAGKRLPYDAEVEYLESTGTQWIDTGVKGNASASLIIECTFLQKQHSGTVGFVFGSRSATDKRFGFAVVPGGVGGNYTFGYRNDHGYNVALSSNFETVRFVATPTVAECTFRGTTLTASDAPLDTNLNIYIFTRNFSGRTGQNFEGCLASLKIYSNGVLVRDLIPVRKGTVGYLYDRVSGKLFGNAGTGDFVVGPDVVPVEYIESHGTEYIDTGFKASNSTRVAVDFERKGGTTNCWILGSRNGTASATDKVALFCGINNNTAYAMLGSAMGQFSSAIIKTGRHLLEMSLAGGVVVDSQVVITYSASEQAEVFSAAYAMVLFNLWNGSSLNNPFIGKYYACDFWDNGVPVRKFIPVRVSTEGAMMDTLTRRIYRNAGTGAFTYGNDLKYPIPAE